MNRQSRRIAPMSDKTSPKYLTLQEFVQLSRLSESTVRRRARDGSLPVVQLGGKGKRLLFPADALTRNSSESASAVDNEAKQTSLPPTTGTLAERPSGPRPRWTQSLARRPR
jgi:hypothetical protein